MTHVITERNEFAPPPQRGMGRAVALALLAHALLVAGLSFSVQWKRNAEDTAAEAELWSAVPQEAAPRAVEPPPPPPPPPAPPEEIVKPRPAPPPAPAVKPPPAPDESLKDAQIALEKERKRKELEKKELEKKEREHQRELEKKAQEKKEREKQEKLDKEKALQQKREAEKAAEKKRQEQLQREKDQERKKQEAEADKRRAAEADAKRKKDAEAADAKRLEAQRADNLKRMAGLAGASGGPSATGTALRSSGPSASYGGRVKARVKPNIVFTDDLPNNPVAEVEVRLAPDGTIVGRKLTKSSGVAAWDEAVLKAIDKTEVLPRDTDGTVPSSLVLVFRPKD
ncbi:MAG: cell envelope integrity protein TolA [Curvibacter sp.]|nr:MAG: cell envelope integrity protein TolA [Curvibacter sp.]